MDTKTMTKAFSTAALGLALVGCASCPFGQDDGYRPIFNGRDLSGWTGATHLFFVEDGELVFREGEKNYGNLYYEKELADFSARNIVSVLVHDANLPAITGFSDCSDLMYVVHTQVNTSRSDRLGQTIVCIIFMIGKVFFPTLNKTRRNGLCADMHKPPLRKRIILEVYVTSVDCVQYILCPRNQKPYNRAFFF